MGSICSRNPKSTIFFFFIPQKKAWIIDQPISHLPQVTIDESQALELESVIQRKLKKKGNLEEVEVLVPWKGATVEDTTWEDFSNMKRRYLDLVGKVL